MMLHGNCGTTYSLCVAIRWVFVLRWRMWMNFQAHTGAERYQKRSCKITTDIIKKLGQWDLNAEVVVESVNIWL